MHFEVLIEDQSGEKFLQNVLPKILGIDNQHSWKIHPYKGIGRIPQKLSKKSNPQHRILLDQLPKLLGGYGKTYKNVPDCAVIVLVDLDDKNLETFLEQLENIRKEKSPGLTVIWGIAIEEGEAWLLGDKAAILKVYPKAKQQILNRYKQDSICGTWEILADAIYPGGSKSLKKKGFPHTGIAKCEWAEKISPHIIIENNESPSFKKFQEDIASTLLNSTTS